MAKVKLSALVKKKVGEASSKVKPKTVVGLIDETYREKPQTFSYAKLLEASESYVEYLRTHDHHSFSRDELMLRFFIMYNAAYAEPVRKKGVFHPSSVEGDCERKLYYEFMGVTPTDEVSTKVEPRIQRIFDTGTWWHTYIQMRLHAAGILDESEAEVISRRWKISGRADGILTLEILGFGKVLLEIKTINNFQFGKVKFAPLPKHETQAGIYARILKVDYICYLYINKDTCEITEHILPVKKSRVNKAFEKMQYVLDSVEEETLPERVHCTSNSSPMALKCQYCTKCFKDPKK